MKIFDAHFHIINSEFPLVENNGYLPPEFTINNYHHRLENMEVVGGALVAETGYVRPGEMVTLNIDLEPGEYVLICSVRGHLERGMFGTVQLQ